MAEIRVKPLGANVLLQLQLVDTMTAAGVLLATTGASEKYKPWARVLAVGPNVANVEVGDQVLFDRYAGKIISWGNETMLIGAGDILATGEFVE